MLTENDDELTGDDEQEEDDNPLVDGRRRVHCVNWREIDHQISAISLCVYTLSKMKWE